MNDSIAANGKPSLPYTDLSISQHLLNALGSPKKEEPETGLVHSLFIVGPEFREPRQATGKNNTEKEGMLI